MTRQVTDFRGNVYDLEHVVAIEKGGTPHTDLPLPRAPVAILVLESGARIDTLVSFDLALAAWKPPAPAAAPAA